MKVYQVNVVCGTGSTGRIVAGLHDLILQAGGECRIAYGRGSAPEGMNAVRISGTADMYHHALMTRMTDRHGLFSRRATRRLIRDIEAFSPDIIHLHNIHGYYVNYRMLFEFLSRYQRKVIWTLHDCWPFTGHCAYYDYSKCEKWKAECEKCANRKEYPAAWRDASRDNYLTKKSAFLSVKDMTIVTPSEWLRGEIQKSFLQDVPCEVIPNGIDLSVFRPTEENCRESPGISDRKLLLGVANIWEKRKGLEDFIKLRSMLGQEYTICLVGLTKAQIEKLPEGMIGIGRTESAQQLAALYSCADLFLNLTYEDNFPTTNMEALSCGTPVLTYDTGGCAEMLDESCGRVVQRGDLEAVVREIGKLMAKPIAGEACVRKSRTFERREAFAGYVSLYRRILEQN